MEKHNFTYEQIKEIYKFLSWINLCNNEIGSNCEVDAITYYKDRYGNFYASYIMHDFISNSASLEYVEIDREGFKTDLTTRYENKNDIAIKLSRYEEIKLND